MDALKRKTLFLALTPGACIVLGLAVYVYYHRVYVPAHEVEWRNEARAKWLHIVASRPGGIWTTNTRVDGDLEELDVLRRCFKSGELAENCASILATGEREDRDGEGPIYRWHFRVPNRKKRHELSSGTFFVHVSGSPPIIDSAYFHDPALRCD